MYKGQDRRRWECDWFLFIYFLFFFIFFLQIFKGLHRFNSGKVSLLEEKVFFQKVHYLLHKDHYIAVVCHKDDLKACEEGSCHIGV